MMCMKWLPCSSSNVNPSSHPTVPISLSSSPRQRQLETHRPSSTPSLISRRDMLAIQLSSGLLLPTLFDHNRQYAHADELVDAQPSMQLPENADCAEVTQKAFLDVSVNGEHAGRIIVGLYGNQIPVGAKRFANLASGRGGVSYKRKAFVRIMPNYIQHAGVRSLGADSEFAKQNRQGEALVEDELLAEWEGRNGRCNGPSPLMDKDGGVFGIIVRDPTKPPPKMKLVARKGKLEIDEEQEREDPNGSEFIITTKAAPELDSSTLPIGKVIEGMDVVRAISQVPSVKENTSSPYFRVAKLIGDKRAVVAERGFNRPYSKVIITSCGLID